MSAISVLVLITVRSVGAVPQDCRTPQRAHLGGIVGRRPGQQVLCRAAGAAGKDNIRTIGGATWTLFPFSINKWLFET